MGSPFSTVGGIFAVATARFNERGRSMGSPSAEGGFAAKRRRVYKRVRLATAYGVLLLLRRKSRQNGGLADG
ncbi:MAG: hypothetical protein RR540_01625 [Oscillospiraceae bacterium]